MIAENIEIVAPGAHIFALDGAAFEPPERVIHARKAATARSC
jgi:hypothetical protein